MPKGLIIGDIHGRISQFGVFKDFLHWSAEQAKEHKVDFVVNLGDTFHNHAVLRSEIVSEFKKHVLSIVNQGVLYFYVVGNHDCYKPDDMTYHAIQGLDGVSDLFVVIDKPTTVNGMSFVPYCVDKKDFPKDLKDIVFCHQSFLGSNYGQILADPNSPSTVDPDSINCGLIYSGHVHLRSEFGKVRHPGTPFAWSASDVDQSKGIVIFDTETLKEVFVESPMPKWHKICLSAEDGLNRIKQKLTNKSDHFIIEMTGSKAALSALLGSKEYKNLIKDYSVSVKAVPTDNDKKINSISAVSLEGIVKEYIEKVYSGPLNKKDLWDAAAELIK